MEPFTASGATATTPYTDYWDDNFTFPTVVYEDYRDCYVSYAELRASLAVQIILILINLSATFVSLGVIAVYCMMWRTLKTSDILMCAMTLCSLMLCTIFFVHFGMVRALGNSAAPKAYCSFLTYSYSTLSIFVLLLTCAVSLVCLLAVARPTWQRRVQHPRTGCYVLMVLCVIALLFALPFLLFREPHEDPFGASACVSVTLITGTRPQMALWKIHSSLCLCTMCLLCTLACYLFIWCRVWWRKRRGRGSGMSRTQRRGFCLTVSILLFMVITYGPNYLAHVIYISVHHNLFYLSCPYLVLLFKSSRYLKVLVQIHTIGNPLLYAALSSAFRAQALEARRRLMGFLARQARRLY